MSRCRSYNITLKRYAVVNRVFRYGNGTSQDDVVWLTLDGYSAYGGLAQPDGTRVEFTVSVVEEAEAGSGGQISVTIDATELLPGRYPYDIWLVPPSEPPFCILSGEVIVEDAVNPNP